MRNNPNEPPNAQKTDVLPPRMGDLPPKVTQSPPPAKETAPNVESAEIRQEEARTVRYAIGKLNDFLQWFMIVLEAALAIRFFLKLISADPNNLFAGFLYALTSIVLFPFKDIVGDFKTFEWQTVIAMIMYWLIFWAIRRFMHILITGPEETTS